MSNPEVGEAFVKLRLDPADFENEIKDTVESSAEEAQKTLDQQIDGQAQKILDLQTKAEAANLRSLSAGAQGQKSIAEAEALSAGLLNLQANIAQAQFAAENTLRSAAGAMGAEREQLLAAAEAYQVAAKIGQDTLDRSIRAGRIVEPNVPGQGGPLGRLEELARGAGTRGGLGQLLASGARLGALGIAATAVFQSFTHLQSALRVTGDEAFSMGGKFRNATASLLTADVVGAFQALTRERPAQIVGDLAAKLEEAKQKGDPLVITQEKLNALYQKSPQELGNYINALVGLDKISVQTGLQMFKIAEANQAVERTARAAAIATGDVAAAIEKAGSEAAAFGEKSNDFGRGVGAIEQERQRTIAQGGPTPLPGTGGTAVGNEIRASIISRIADDQKRTALELENAKTIQAQRRATFENVRNTEAAAGAWKDYVIATTAVAKATEAAKNATETAATAAQDAANTVRDAQAGRIRDEGARLQAELANARIVERQKQAAARAAEGTRQAAAANAAYEQAVTARVQIENQIKDRNDAAAKAAQDERQSTEAARLANAEARAALTARTTDDIAAIKATRDYYQNLAKTLSGSAAEAAKAEAIAATARLKSVSTGDAAALREQRLQNALQASALTGRLSDDKKAAEQLVAFWKSQVNDAEGLAKARAEGDLLSAKARLDAVEQATTNLKEQKIQNRIQAARLTADSGDDKRAANDLVKFWQKQFKEAEGAAKVTAQSRLIAAKLARQALEGDKTDAGGPSTIDFLGISQQITREFAGNLLPTGSSSALAGLFKLPGITAGGSPEEQQVDELKKIRQLLEQKGIGAAVTVNQSFRDPDQSGFVQARFAKLAMVEAFNG